MIRDRYPGIDMALVYLGGTSVLGQLLTMDGKEGADLVELLRPRCTVPVHYDDYGLFKSPLSEFQVEARRRDLRGVKCVVRGDTLALRPSAESPEYLGPASRGGGGSE